MTKLFISDLHLDASRPAATNAFVNFLQGSARKATDLYILGDLFETWIGDDDPNPHYAEVATAIRSLSDSGVRCFYMAGNRDFVIGEKFLQRCGMTRLYDPALISVGNQSVLVSHGDIYCTDDLGYQRYRRVVYNPIMRGIYDALPFSARSWVVSRIRSSSQNKMDFTPPEIMDVNQDAIESALKEHAVSTILHGHTHRPAIHDFKLNGKPARRIVLGDWYTQGSVLRWDDKDKNGPALEKLAYSD
ncbi:MAG: UDP-2,3-diacylglucosamine diphosphatase [Gammaproteobacteria bacterium]